jgi:hypothetical protein
MRNGCVLWLKPAIIRRRISYHRYRIARQKRDEQWSKTAKKMKAFCGMTEINLKKLASGGIGVSMAAQRVSFLA